MGSIKENDKKSKKIEFLKSVDGYFILKILFKLARKHKIGYGAYLNVETGAIRYVVFDNDRSIGNGEDDFEHLTCLGYDPKMEDFEESLDEYEILDYIDELAENADYNDDELIKVNKMLWEIVDKLD